MATVIPGIKLKLFYQYENGGVVRREEKKAGTASTVFAVVVFADETQFASQR